jgi:hypothetical protein
MHFFYLDESGCTGADLESEEQPIFVLGGLSVRDEGWNKTQQDFASLIDDYFHGNLSANFELHGSELLSPNGEGPFEGHALDRRLNLASKSLDLISKRNHSTHVFAIQKSKVIETACEVDLLYNPSIPFLCAFDYLITYINEHVKSRLGLSARGMVIMDKKEEFHEEVECITYHRRFQAPRAHRVKWIVEFSYPVDSHKNPMVQLSDLIVLCARRFFEVECGYRENWLAGVKKFYAQCYAKIYDRISRKQLVPRKGRGMDRLNDYLEAIRCKPVGQWKRRYGL